MKQSFSSKFIPKESLASVSEKIKKDGRVIVTTNGCFDILHLGHVRYLQAAKKLGDILIIGVNSDSSVKKLKGPNRPLNTAMVRAEILAALECVDYVTIFEEDTPVNLVNAIRPNIHVKGGDYEGKETPEKKAIEAFGGKAIFLKFEDGYSTTDIIEKSKKS